MADLQSTRLAANSGQAADGRGFEVKPVQS